MLKTSMTGRWREEAVSCPFLGLLLGVSIAAHAHGAPMPATAQLISRVVALETNRVHFVTGGEGTNVLLFVHGWGGSTDLWREQVPAFADRARLIFVDLPGHGRSDQPMRNYSMDFFAQAILALLKDVQVPKATLIGHSMGVAVVARVHGLAPERVAALVAVDGFLRRPEFKPEEAEQFIAPFRGAEYREHTRRFIGAMFPNPGTEALRDRMVADVLKTPQHVLSGAMDGMFEPGQPAWDLQRVAVPVLVLNAPNPMWTPEYQAYVRSLSPRTDYRSLEGVGHFLMLEKPADFNRELLDMLRRFQLVDR